MSGTLTFPVDETLRAIVAHARSAPTRSPSCEELYDPACRRDGREPAEDAFPTADEIDPAKIPYGLWLVKDEGVYLMSPGDPRLPAAEGDGNLVAYAIEANPRNPGCRDAARAIMGGDDCVEKLGLDFFEKAIANGMTRIAVKVTPTQISITAHR